MPAITPTLWFDTEALEAAEFYCSVFPNSAVENVARFGDGGPRDSGTVMTVSFSLDGRAFTALNGGPEFHFNEAVSFFIDCRDQREVDHYWDALVEGGSESQCGWLKDRFGVSWQVVPAELGSLLGDPDPDRAARAMKAMLGMKKIDVSALRRAANGDPQA